MFLQVFTRKKFRKPRNTVSQYNVQEQAVFSGKRWIGVRANLLSATLFLLLLLALHCLPQAGNWLCQNGVNYFHLYLVPFSWLLWQLSAPPLAPPQPPSFHYDHSPLLQRFFFYLFLFIHIFASFLLMQCFFYFIRFGCKMQIACGDSKVIAYFVATSCC